VFSGTSWNACGSSCYDEKTDDCCANMTFSGNSWNNCRYMFRLPSSGLLQRLCLPNTNWKSVVNPVTMKRP
jgi:hypothetical protein